MKRIACLLLVLVSVVALGQHNKKGAGHSKIKAFSGADYPSDNYSTKIEDMSFGEVKIEAIHVLETGLVQDPACKAWLEIKKGNKNTGMLFFDDIMNDSGLAGVFFPKKQPREDLFIAMKYGDYDGRIIIVDRDGNANSMPGGDFYVSEDNKYLFSNYKSDQTGVTIIDMDKNDLIYSDSAKRQNKLGQWYYQDDKFFAVAQPDPNDEDTTQLNIATLDLKKKKLVMSKVDKDYPQKDSKLLFYTYFDKPDNKGNCTCGKR